jgi:uncharacterized membrane-anchored protein
MEPGNNAAPSTTDDILARAEFRPAQLSPPTQRLVSTFPPDHPQRIGLADEVHARPPEPLPTPARASYVAVLVDSEAREQELRHLQTLCKRYAVSGPPTDASHFRTALGALRLKWERHGEFSGYTFSVDGLADTPFDTTAAQQLPSGWLAAIPGRTVAAVHAEVSAAAPAAPDADALAARFAGHMVVGAEIAEGAATLYTDFRLHDDGCSRIWLVNRRLTLAQTGRMLQRLFEIEAYRVLALLALPIARRQGPRIAAIEDALATLTDQMARIESARGLAKEDTNDEALLHELMRLAAEVESGIAASQFRFGACEAYHGLVLRRIAELREARLSGLQTIDEFMSRRLAPAAATCSNVSQRLKGLADRIGQASALLATRVGIEREHQNQALLASMDRRAKLQLRLQQTVEGLSIAAIVYYVAGLIGYLAKALRGAGVRIEPDVAVGVSIPVVAVFMVWTVRRMRRKLKADNS